jgi:hypothetical protein
MADGIVKTPVAKITIHGQVTAGLYFDAEMLTLQKDDCSVNPGYGAEVL